MKVTVTIEDKDYSVETPVEFPDAEQLMCSVELVINMLGYPEEEIENYIVGWAEEIKLSKHGKE